MDFGIFGLQFFGFWILSFLFDFWLPNPINAFATPIQKMAFGSGKLSAPSPSKKLRFSVLVRNLYHKRSNKWMTVFESGFGMLVSGTKNMTNTISKKHFWISRSLDFWILGFLDVLISRCFDFWISVF